MRKYRGLFLREMYISRKTILGTAVAFVLVLIYAVMIGLSTRYGNLRNISEEAGVMLDMSKYMFIFLPAMMSSSFCSPSASVVSDRKCGWQKYCYTLPITAREFITFKFGMIALTLAAGFVISVLSSMATLAAFGESYKAWHLLIIVYAELMISVMMFVSIPMSFFTKNTDVTGMVSVFVMYLPFVPAGIEVYRACKRFLAEHDIEQMNDIPDELQRAWQDCLFQSIKDLFTVWWWAWALFFLLVAAVSVFVTKKLYDRRVC